MIPVNIHVFHFHLSIQLAENIFLSGFLPIFSRTISVAGGQGPRCLSFHCCLLSTKDSTYQSFLEDTQYMFADRVGHPPKTIWAMNLPPYGVDWTQYSWPHDFSLKKPLPGGSLYNHPKTPSSPPILLLPIILLTLSNLSPIGFIHCCYCYHDLFPSTIIYFSDDIIIIKTIMSYYII